MNGHPHALARVPTVPNKLEARYKVRPKYFQNLNPPRERDVVQGSVTRYCKPAIF